MDFLSIFIAVMLNILIDFNVTNSFGFFAGTIISFASNAHSFISFQPYNFNFLNIIAQARASGIQYKVE